MSYFFDSERFTPIQFDPLSWRNAPPLRDDLVEQIQGVEPSANGRLLVHPCQVQFASGRIEDRVLVMNAEWFTSVWSVDHRQWETLSLTDAVSFRESPSRLPAAIANRIYLDGERNMGAYAFELSFEGRPAVQFVVGSFVDFVDLPPGYGASECTTVRPLREDLDESRARRGIHFERSFYRRA